MVVPTMLWSYLSINRLVFCSDNFHSYYILSPFIRLAAIGNSAEALIDYTQDFAKVLMNNQQQPRYPK
jgi:hypothetical protein